MPRSLADFFRSVNSESLNACDEEPVHLIGHVQAEGALLVLDPDTLSVRAASANLERHLGIDPAALHGASGSLEAMLPNLAQELREIEALAATPRVLHTILADEVQGPEATFQCVAHAFQGRLYLEFLPDSALSIAVYRQRLRALRRFATGVMGAPNFAGACELAVQAATALVGCQRAMIYQFREDGSGEVLSEHRTGELDSYLGLVFPATDIPKQARELMRLVPWRLLASVNDEVAPIVDLCGDQAPDALDLSHSVLRAASVFHTQYLRNMGVGATFTTSLYFRGSLWGMISCHFTSPTGVPFDLFGAMEDLATSLMAKLEQETAKDTARALQRLRAVEESLAHALLHQNDLTVALGELTPELRTFLQADGFAIHYGTTVITDGRVPPTAFIHELIEWATQVRRQPGTYATTGLHQDFPSASAHLDTACGILIEPIRFNRACYLIWFRGPVTQTVRWAGSPAKPEGEHGILTPRHSFQEWVESHRDVSASWTDAERAAAAEILKNLLDILAAQASLQTSHDSLQTFSFAASHDLKGPLRHIRIALDLASQAESVEELADVKEILSHAKASSERLKILVDSITTYLMAGQSRPLAAVSLPSLFASLQQRFAPELKAMQGELQIDASATVVGDDGLLVLLFDNLIANAIKYRKPDAPPRIRVVEHVRPLQIEVRVEDNGVGIPAQDRQRVFEPFQRVARGRTDVEGSGLGLAICRRVVELHGGRMDIDPDYTGGTAFVVVLRRARGPAEDRDSRHAN